jgi:hypothetical protein
MPSMALVQGVNVQLILIVPVCKCQNALTKMGLAFQKIIVVVSMSLAIVLNAQLVQ